jgi:hypothetical protein
MATIMIVHEVEDVDDWLASGVRNELMGRLGITGQLFTDPAKTKRVGLLLDVPDMDAFHELLESDEGAEAMRHDGVRPDTVVLLEQAADQV